MLLNVIESKDTIKINFFKLKTSKVVDDLIMFLNSIKDNKKKIVLDFTGINNKTYSNTHTTMSGIIDYYKSKGLDIEVLDKGYISATSLKEPVHISSDNDLENKSIFDKVIKFDNTSVDIVADSIINQIKYLFVCEKNFLPALSWCLKEIMDNVIVHSGTNQGLIMAQVHHRRRLVNISIFDSGLGLLSTLSESGEFSPKNELEAIDLALTHKVSGNRNIGQGNGMWGLKQIVRNNKGHLSVMSGHAIKIFDYEKDEEEIYDNLAVLGENNQCTRIDFSLNFDNVIDIKESLGNYSVYETINSDIENMENENDWIIFDVKKQAILGTGTRQSGKQLRKYLINIMNTSDKKIVIDFKDVDMVSSSFADELIAQLILEVGKDVYKERFVLSNVNEYCNIIISSSIRQRVDF
ncbi:MAG: STAS-like domain-containing protein [Erysipelotrichaceae bacterium]|nr:STAS-like domain-containing protein [Erysipelotrichaceae bacterium]